LGAVAGNSSRKAQEIAGWLYCAEFNRKHAITAGRFGAAKVDEFDFAKKTLSSTTRRPSPVHRSACCGQFTKEVVGALERTDHFSIEKSSSADCCRQERQ